MGICIRQDTFEAELGCGQGLAACLRRHDTPGVMCPFLPSFPPLSTVIPDAAQRRSGISTRGMIRPGCLPPQA